MSRKLNRNLITLLFLFGSISFAKAQSSAGSQSTVNPGSSGWTFYQDSIATFCAANSSSCNITINGGEGLRTAPTTDVWIVTSNTTNNVTITNVSGGGGTWVHCPNCFQFAGHGTDAWYNLTGAPSFAGNITVTLSGAASNAGWANFIELVPPPGTTPSFDTSGHTSSASCSTCNAVQLTTTGTDAIFQQMNIADPNAWNAWNAPYITSYAADGFNLNSTTGLQATPTVTTTSTGAAQFMALAFKSSAGTFTPTSSQFSVKNFVAPQGVNCNPNCSVTIPATTAGDLLYVQSGNLGSHITSVTGGGSWIVDPNCQVSMNQAGNDNLSCSYLLSVAANTTTLNISMSGSAATYFAIWEIANASGTAFSLDAIGKTTNSASLAPPGQVLSITGTNDVIFQSVFAPGGTSSWTLMPMPRIIVGGAGGMFYLNQAANAVILNSGPAPSIPNWNDQQNLASIVTGVAFKAVGGSTSVNPPTGLTVAVQ
jgi:hypothetical protein